MGIIETGRVIEGSGTGTPLRLATGTPNSPANTPYAGIAKIGSVLVEEATGKLWICTATNGSTTITWTVVGAQVP
jgi:hypothetical protein